MAFIEKMKRIAKTEKKRIVFPEAFDKRIQQAAVLLANEGLAEIILLGEKTTLVSDFPELANDHIHFIDPNTDARLSSYANTFFEKRKHKGIDLQTAEKMMKETMFFAVMMLEKNEADGVVAGAHFSTADVLRPSLQILKTAPNVNTVSSFFVMVCKDKNWGFHGNYIFSDCALIQEPNAEQLSDIAVSCAKSFEDLFEQTPKVALLSHSTRSSAKHEKIDKVVEAYHLAKDKNPSLCIDGELQVDAAIVPAIQQQKAADSVLKGQANILIFPDIDAGNIAYKLVQRLALAKAYGPITQGIKKPVNDLSRGCSVEDIFAVAVITCVQAIKNKEEKKS